ncbi:restriction endonuclease subunit S [Fulvivirga sp. M361]|uniref:restriction endonuclease subunit S n=1 Tax=Fulvivirga sp. M361 TaxID=2594266 RepID=UPI001624840A|nr:restriction endonuclease subunit S [Fulvivirga sp. M361]
MLEGLEISIKNLSEVYFDNPTLRYDSEYFKKEYTTIIGTILSNECEKVDDLSSWVTQGPNPIFNEDGNIPCLTGRNINNGTVNYNNPDYVDSNEYGSLKRFQLKKGDTLITLKGKGSIGKIGYVTDERPAIFSRDVGIIRPNAINSGYVNAYILSEYGKKVIERGETGGTGQSTLTTSYLKNIDIPRFSIESNIGDLVELSEEILKKSQDTYQQAEQLLLQEIDLQDFIPSQEPVNVKSFQESFGKSGRLDAEYYQVKYEEMVSEITRQNHDKLHNLVEISKSIEPGSANYEEYGLPFIRVSDYSKFGVTTPDKYLSDSFVLQNKELIKSLKPKKGTILFSKDGSVGTAYHLREDKSFITSGAILHLKVKDESKIIPEYLTLALNSKVVKMQAERDAGGSIILHWRVGEIENIVVPIIPTNKQREIAELIEQSFSLKKQSEHLLEIAKQAVEMAIEYNETATMEWLKERTKDII